MRPTLSLLIFATLGLLPAPAQDGTKPASVLHIIRETTKEGRAAAHEKIETEWVMAARRLKDPQHSVALEALSGGSDLWFILPTESFASAEDYMKFTAKEPAQSTYAILDARDGELRASSQSLWAVYRPDLSYHVDRLHPAKVRFVALSKYQARPGRSEDLVSGAKTYLAAMEKAHIDECTLAYQVVAGAPAGTFFFFTMMDSLKAMDEEQAHVQAIHEAMGAEAFSGLMKGGSDVLASMDNTLLRVNPEMSYVDQKIIDADPGFWKPKPVPAAKPAASSAPAAPEKKSAQ